MSEIKTENLLQTEKEILESTETVDPGTETVEETNDGTEVVESTQVGSGTRKYEALCFVFELYKITALIVNSCH